jgi:hypothetical protein
MAMPGSASFHNARNLIGGAGFGLIAGKGESTGHAEVGKNADDFVGDDTRPIENFLKFRGSSKTLARREQAVPRR